MPHPTRTTPENITDLGTNEIFVFGSNTGGRHGKGAALTAKEYFGAEQFIGEGFTGECYALPTVIFDLHTRRLLKMPTDRIERHVAKFIVEAEANPSVTFLVTAIGCGLAGYSAKDIAPMFRTAPDNVVLPQSFIDILNQ